MNWFTRLLNQDITLWTAGAPDGFGGFTYTTTLISGLWETKEDIFYDSDGAEKRSSAVAHVDQSVPLRSFLAKGDHTSTSDPTAVSGAAEVQAVRETTSIDGRVTTYKALLQQAGQG